MEMPAIPQPTFYIFKCEQSSPPGMPKPSCVREQSRDLFNHMAQTMMQKGLMGPVQAIRTSCLGRCQMGPVMLIEPGPNIVVPTHPPRALRTREAIKDLMKK